MSVSVSTHDAGNHVQVIVQVGHYGSPEALTPLEAERLAKQLNDAAKDARTRTKNLTNARAI